jgi:hypothetical protein
VKDLKYSIKLGDIVAVTGRFENDHVLQAVTVTVVQAWKASNGRTAFKPQPASLKRLYKQHQQQQQQQQDDIKGQQDDLSQPATGAEAGCGDAGGTDTRGTAASNPAEAAGAEAGCGDAGGTDAPGTTAVDPQAAAAAAVLQDPLLVVCKFWVNTGRCAKGDACPYAHLVDVRKSWVKRRWATMLKPVDPRAAAAAAALSPY